ncbi:MAG: DNA double-strand break repair nuclease NurA [Anaerolineae bacterium]|nr:DNA double-strand break repair nuclease NurA [Anaerolineae bacterium]
MGLEFNKVVEQVLKLGHMVEALDFDLGEKLQIAVERFYNPPPLEKIRERVELVQGPTVSGYRGAVPLEGDLYEDVTGTYDAPPLPPTATVIAADGSQIYPREQSPVHYYLINVGLFVYYHGVDALADQITLPVLAFHKDHVHDRSGRVISNRTVDARRTVMEMKELGKLAWARRDSGGPLLTLYDNHLLFGVNANVSNHQTIMRDYRAALVHLHDSGAVLAGYIDNPVRSRVMIRMLYLLSLSDQAVLHSDLSTGGDLEGLKDIHLFNAVLQPGQRSAIMVQNSPRNLDYKEGPGGGASYEIAFFYLKVSSGFRSAVARVDIPMWVARDRQKVDHLHALLVAQCDMQGRNPYPYALTRADELAVVSSRDKAKLDELINMELRKKGIDPVAISAKAWSKVMARSEKRRFSDERKHG